MEPQIFETMQIMAERREAAMTKCTGMTCPKCGNEQIELVSYQPKILLKCRDPECRERWVVED